VYAPLKYFLDTEFIESGPGAPIWLLSIGIVAEDGRELYYVNSDAPLADANDWVKVHVLPHLNLPRPGYPHEFAPLETIRDRVRLFCAGWDYTAGARLAIFPRNEAYLLSYDLTSQPDKTIPEFWGYYADYDWVVFCQIFGRMVDLPKGYPMYCNDLRQWLNHRGRLDIHQPENPHNSLLDARWIAETYRRYK
jgi:hypothetical protein